MCPYHPPDGGGRAAFGGERPALMRFDRFRALVEALTRSGTRDLDLVGRGEPLLNPSVVEMVRFARARGARVGLTTNGSRLDATMARGLVDAGLDKLRVSLNAARPTTYPLVHVSESPASFRRVTGHVAGLVAARRASAAARPHVTVSFTISSRNHAELVEMVELAAALGVDAAFFQHVLDEPGGALALGDEDYASLLATGLPAAVAAARRAGLTTNLDSFAATPPPGRLPAGASQVVPCYVGSYFTVVLGNGSVLPCCQIERPVGSLRHQSFDEIWHGEAYREFRRAARALPTPHAALATAQCDRCYFRPHNVAIHRMLHPLGGAAEASAVRVRQLLRMSRLDPG